MSVGDTTLEVTVDELVSAMSEAITWAIAFEHGNPKAQKYLEVVMPVIMSRVVKTLLSDEEE